MEYSLLLFFLIFLWAYYDTVWAHRNTKQPYIPPRQPTIDPLPDRGKYPLEPYIPMDSTTLDNYNLNQFRVYKAIYLQSNQWKTKRQLILSRDNHKCIDCGATTRLEVHHLQYKQLANEPLSHLVTLCRTCHEHHHTKLGIPQTYQEYFDFNDIL